MVRSPRPTRSAVAASAQRLSGMAGGSHAAADPGADGHSVLPALPRSLPDPDRSRWRRTRRRARVVVRSRLLLARPQSAPRRADLHRPTRRRIAERYRCHLGLARNRPLDCRRHPCPGSWSTRADPRRQRAPRAVALSGSYRRAGVDRSATATLGAVISAAPGRAPRRLHPGADGSRRHPVYTPQAAVRPMSHARRLCCAPARQGGGVSRGARPPRATAAALQSPVGAGRPPAPAAAPPPADRRLGRVVVTGRWRYAAAGDARPAATRRQRWRAIATDLGASRLHPLRARYRSACRAVFEPTFKTLATRNRP